MDQETTNHDWLALLQDRGYRVTGPRRAIVDILASSIKALSPLEIYDAGRVKYPGLGLVTVYRTLEKLEALGLVQRVHQPDGCHMVVRTVQGHQHLMLCTICGRTEYFSGDDLLPLMETIHHQKGFMVSNHWLQFFGICDVCQGNDQKSSSIEHG